jgi:hypothetical protein
MKTMILASILVLTAMAWTSQVMAQRCGGEDQPRCGIRAGVHAGAVPKQCQVKCANAATPSARLACYKEKC